MSIFDLHPKNSAVQINNVKKPQHLDPNRLYHTVKIDCVIELTLTLDTDLIRHRGLEIAEYRGLESFRKNLEGMTRGLEAAYGVRNVVVEKRPLSRQEDEE